HGALVPAVVAGAAIAPGVVDHVGAQARVRVVALEIGRRGHELAAGEQVGAGAACGSTTQAGNPVGLGSDADLLVAAVSAHGGAAYVGAVGIGPLRLGRAADVEPVVVVVEAAAAEVAAVLVDQGLVRVARTRVDNADD